MRDNKGASVPDQALAVPATPANAVDGPSGFDPSRIIAKMSPAQKKWLEEICRTSGGGVRIACRVTDEGEVVPSNGALRKLFDKGLIQGKSGAYERVVHTREGWAVRAAIATEARRAETVEQGSVHEGAGPKDIAQ